MSYYFEKIKTERKINGMVAVELLRDAMQTQGPDFKYKNKYGTCQNFDALTGTIGQCIVGVVAEKLGFNADQVGQGMAETTVDNLRAAGYTVTKAANQAFAVAQEVQDGGATWGVAVKAAQRAVGNVGEDAL